MTQELARAVLLFVLTLASMFWVGAQWEGATLDPFSFPELLRGYTFALPLMAILLSHELGHYFAARRHGVDTSPPYFIPMPFGFIGTFGAVIRMRGKIRTRNALFDIGAAGPLCGLAVALPVLIHGIRASHVTALDPSQTYLVEGRSLLYLGLLYGLKGPIPEGSDVLLNPTAFAGWAGLLVTMINLIPVGQLDGGHVAYALFGGAQNRYSRFIRRSLPVVALVVGGAAAVAPLLEHRGFDEVIEAALSGVHWLMWWLVLTLLARFTGEEHPPTEPSALSPIRRALSWFTLSLFVLLFMPRWISTG